VSVNNVGSDLYLRNIEGHCLVEAVGSDLVLNLEFKPNLDYRFSVGSDILCRVQPDTNARFELPLDVPVRVDIKEEIEQQEDGDHQNVVLGDGSAVIHVEACEELRLVGEEEDFAFDLGIQIEEQVEARLSTLEDRLAEQLEGLDEKIQAKAQLWSQRWSSQAERMAEQAQHQAERAAERLRRSMDKQKRKRGPSSTRVDFAWDVWPPQPPQPRSLRSRPGPCRSL